MTPSDSHAHSQTNMYTYRSMAAKDHVELNFNVLETHVENLSVGFWLVPFT